jgi:hypothetical protein
MKSTRNIILSALLTIAAFGTITYTSCNKDKCKDVVCSNGGTCDTETGNCMCATGYEGTTCETEIRAKFLKTWAASDVKTTTSTTFTYSSTVAKGTTVTDILIGGFSKNFFDHDVKATVSGNTITIASQAPDNDGYTVSGTGSYNATDKKITWTYTLTSPISGAESYTGSWQ